MHAWTQFGMLSMHRSKTPLSRSSHCCQIMVRKIYWEIYLSFATKSLTFLLTVLFKTAHTFSIGFRSGLYESLGRICTERRLFKSCWMSREVYYGHFSCKNRNVNEVRELTTYGTLTDLEFVIIFFLLCFNFTSCNKIIILQKFSFSGIF